MFIAEFRRIFEVAVQDPFVHDSGEQQSALVEQLDPAQTQHSPVWQTEPGKTLAQETL